MEAARGRTWGRGACAGQRNCTMHKLTNPDRASILAASEAIDGWLLPAEAAARFDLGAYGPGHGSIVEVGTFVGKSLVCLAGGAKLHGRERVTSIDLHTGSPEHQPGGLGPRRRARAGRRA
jgi:hypothetical protein